MGVTPPQPPHLPIFKNICTPPRDALSPGILLYKIIFETLESKTKVQEKIEKNKIKIDLGLGILYYFAKMPNIPKGPKMVLSLLD